MKAAFYRGTRPGIAGIYNRLVRWWTRSEFSHVELVLSTGRAWSASFADGGVRNKLIDFDTANWILIDLPPELEQGAEAAFIAEEALHLRPIEALLAWVGRQPPWSDMPFVVLTSHRLQPAVVAGRSALVAALRNVSLLERPV